MVTKEITCAKAEVPGKIEEMAGQGYSFSNITPQNGDMVRLSFIMESKTTTNKTLLNE